MSIPVLEDPLEFLNNVDLNEPFEFATDGVADDFTNDVITCSLVGAGGARLDMSTVDDTIRKTGPGAFQFNVERAVMWALPAGNYDFDIIRSTPSGSDTPLLRGKIKLVKGATQP